MLLASSAHDWPVYGRELYNKRYMITPTDLCEIKVLANLFQNVDLDVVQFRQKIL